ncbi:amidohydrolase family protein [candidate division KSB1 bacterium]
MPRSIILACLIALLSTFASAQEIPPEPYPDNVQRWEGDNGFSRGFAMTNHAYSFNWFDSHMHLAYSHYPTRLQGGQVQEVMDKWFGRVGVYNSGKAIFHDPYLETMEWAKGDPRVYVFWWLKWEQTDQLPEIKRRVDEGLIQGLKLHTTDFRNNPEHDYRIMANEGWKKIWAYCNEAELPVMLHLNQRWGAQGYTYGGSSQEFWAKAGYTNEELLDFFLKEMAAKYPKVKWILAHMNYQGNESLAKIFDKYPNVYVDTSIGMFSREYDFLTPEEIKPYRNFCMKYADRIMFGTDAFAYHPLESSYPGHVRNWWLPHYLFITQLRLPQDTLDKITHGTCEAILGKYLKD